MRNSKSSVCNTKFFSGHGKPPDFFLLYTLITLVILNTEFGLIWTTPWPDENEFFLKLSKIRNSPNSQNSVWKPIFFLGKLYKQLFCFVSSLHWWYSIPHLIWFGKLLNPMKKTFFKNSQKNRNSRSLQKSVWRPSIFPRQAIPKILFALHSHYTGDTPYRVWFDLENSLTPWKRPL